MKFKCSRLLDTEKEIWTGEIVSYSNNNNSTEIYIQSRSSIHVIVGESEYGNYACIPNFNRGCYLSTLDDLFWNTESLVKLIGEVDGITVANAIKYADKNLINWSF